MSDLPLSLNYGVREKMKKASQSEALVKKEIQFHGFNLDLVEPYYWNINFPLYRGKGYVPVKIEDHHFYSETSQYGAQVRQMKGGTIRAFQENLQQLVNLVKVHMMPLLKEVKKADELKGWMDSIVKNDVKYQRGLNKNLPKDDKNMIMWSRARDEAINHLKDRWVNEVDGGRLWQMNRSQAEGGLDMVLLPQLFFGTKLDNPLYMLHGKGKDLAKQLDEYTYQIDITTDALQAVARFQYKFYQWLPTAIKETDSTFKIKISSLKQFYSQLQMYIQFMKPLLVEIVKKSEGFEKTHMFHKFEDNNPDFWNALDFSYSYVRIIGVNGIMLERKGEGMEPFTFCPHGYYLKDEYLLWGPHKGKNGIITEEVKYGKGDEEVIKYKFKLCGDLTREEALEISEKEFNKFEEVEIFKSDLKLFASMEFGFSQKRRNEIKQTQQGPQQVPFMQNAIIYTGYAWNMFELATYREQMKHDEMELLEHFIGEVSVMKEDLMYYVGILNKKKEFDTSMYDDEEDISTSPNSPSQSSEAGPLTLVTGPFKAVGSMFSLGSSSSSNSDSNSVVEPKYGKEEQEQKEDQINSTQSAIVEDTWKLYSIFKKAHGYMQY